MRQLFLLAALLLLSDAYSSAQVDCVQNRTSKVSDIQGVVVDPFGIAVPAATVTAWDQNGHVASTQTNAVGRFSIRTSKGKYEFKASMHAFEDGKVELIVRRNVFSSLRHEQLYVILGLAGSYCSWVTTSDKDFEYNIRANKKRSKEFEQKNATQK